MTASDKKPIIGSDGEVREITSDDLKFAKRGRPPMPTAQRKRRVNLMLDPDVADALDRTENKSAAANDAIRKALM